LKPEYRTAIRTTVTNNKIMHRARRRNTRTAKLALALFAVLFALTACVNDLNPGGGWSGIVSHDDYLYFGSKDGRVVRVSSTTGTFDQAWSYPVAGTNDLGEIYGTPVVSPEGVIYGSAFRCKGNSCDGEVFAADAVSGQSAWAGGTFKIKTRLVGSVGLGESTLAVGTAAIGGKDVPPGTLIGLDPTVDSDKALADQVSNREKWRIPLNGPVWGGITVSNDIAYFGTLQHTLYAVDLSDNAGYARPEDRILWTFDTGGAIAGTPFVTDTNLYVGTFGNNVYSLDLTYRKQHPNTNTLDASSEWQFDTGAWIWATPVLSDGALYVANMSGDVFALNAENGQMRWNAPAKAGEEIVASPFILESNRGPALGVTSGEKDITVIVLASGQIAGEFVTDGNGTKSSPVSHGDTVFVHTDTGQLRQYKANTLSLVNCIDVKEGGKTCK
jgi:outer membrane protein assembly factor BamB